MSDPELNDFPIEQTRAAFHDAIERTRALAAETGRRLSALAPADETVPGHSATGE